MFDNYEPSHVQSESNLTGRAAPEYAIDRYPDIRGPSQISLSLFAPAFVSSPLSNILFKYLAGRAQLL
jgi:hypothetical protein